MEHRQLGTQGLRVSALGMGCMGLSYAYGSPPEDAQSKQLLRRAVELGITFFDTAEIYGPFRNEILVGDALRSVRDQVVIATKFGFAVPPEGGRPRGLDSHPKHIREVCDAALRRLRIDTIDLFYQHRVDPYVPIEDVAGAVADLVRKGKVRYFGLSEAGAETIRRAHAIHPVSAVQSEYSLWTRDSELSVLPACRELGIGFVAYSPLGRGFLAGPPSSLADDDFRKNIPRWQGNAFANNARLVETLGRLATDRGLTLAQLSLAWVLHKGEDIVPIPGTTRISRLEENAASADVRLSEEDMAAIEHAVPASAVQGQRYDEVGLAMLDF